MGHCIHCGSLLEGVPLFGGGGSAAPASCGMCGREARAAGPDDTLALCPHCKAHTPFVGKFCAGCGLELPTVIESLGEPDPPQSSPFTAEWPMSLWSGEPRGQEAPVCPRCGQKIRSDDSPRHGFIGHCQPPWNAAWEGTCEACEKRFELYSEQPLHVRAKRTLRVRPANQFHQTFIDEAIVLSGLEITVTSQEAGGMHTEPTATTLFLSMSELMQMLQALQRDGDLSPCLDQLDWTEDWT